MLRSASRCDDWIVSAAHMEQGVLRNMTSFGDPRSARVARVLQIFGAVLLAIGLAGYLLPSGAVHWTALIPAKLGFLALAISFAVRWPVAAAVAGGLVCGIALLGGGSAVVHLPALLAGEAGAAVASRSATAVVAVAALAGLVRALLSQPASPQST